MRILLTTPYPRAMSSGVASFVRLIERRLREEGHSLIVVEPLSTASPFLANVRLAARTAREVVRHRRGMIAVHCQQLHPQSFAAGFAGRALGVRVLVTVHGRSPRPRGLRGVVLVLSEWLAAWVPHQLIFVSKDLRREFRGRGRVIPSGVPVEEIRAASAEGTKIRTELGLEDAFVIMYVGRVTLDKGVMTLVHAYDRVRTSVRRDVRLVLVGPVEDGIRADLQRRAATSGGGLIVVGERRDPYRFLGAAQLFTLPSSREGMPVSLLEAMAAGLPVIASSVGDVPEIVRDRETGLLVAPGDVDGLAGAVRWMIEHPREASDMGGRAAALVEGSYDVESVWSPYRDLYGLPSNKPDSLS